MPAFTLVDAYAYMAGHDLTGESNEIHGNADADVLDGTTFRPSMSSTSARGWRDKAMGLKKTSWAMKGFYQSALADAVDPEIINNLGVSNRVLTLASTEVETRPAYMVKSIPINFSWLGKVGELAPFECGGSASDQLGLVRGTLLKAMGVVAATGALGTGVQLGAISSTQKLYATFHVFGTPGTTITVVIESATANTFVGATTRATIGPLTTAGGTWVTPVVGPVTDTWWRMRVSAITGSFTVAGAAGIQ